MHQLMVLFLRLLFVCCWSVGVFSAGARAGEEQQWSVIDTYAHPNTFFTEGLSFNDRGQLVESTGLYSRSKLVVMEVNEQSLTLDQVHQFDQPQQQFGEGSVTLNGELFWLTYRAYTCYVFDANSSVLIRQHTYAGEGWGLTTDGTRLMMSNGSTRVYFRSSHMNITGSVDTGQRNLNELEYINGKIYANVWMSSTIVVIDPNTGLIEQRLNFGSLRALHGNRGVLNGIAYDSRKPCTLFLTGKNWAHLYHISLPLLCSSSSSSSAPTLATIVNVAPSRSPTSSPHTAVTTTAAGTAPPKTNNAVVEGIVITVILLMVVTGGSMVVLYVRRKEGYQRQEDSVLDVDIDRDEELTGAPMLPL